MDLVKPREKILKKVRNALIGRTDLSYISEPTISKPVAPSTSEETPVFQLQQKLGLQNTCEVCVNKYDFLDKFLTFLESTKSDKVICTDSRVQGFLESCGQGYVEESIIGSQDAVVMSTVSTAVSETGTLTFYDQAIDLLRFTPTIFVVNHDQIVKTMKTLLDRVRYQYSVGDRRRVAFLQPGKLDKPTAVFIIKDNQA